MRLGAEYALQSYWYDRDAVLTGTSVYPAPATNPLRQSQLWYFTIKEPIPAGVFLLA